MAEGGTRGDTGRLHAPTQETRDNQEHEQALQTIEAMLRDPQSNVERDSVCRFMEVARMLADVLGDARAVKLMKYFVEHTDRPGFLDDMFMAPMNREGLKGFVEVYGEGQAASEFIDRQYKLFGFTKDQWIKLGEALGDEHPSPWALTVVKESRYTLEWIEGAERIRAMRDLLEPAEFKALLSLRNTRDVLLYDETHKRGWGRTGREQYPNGRKDIFTEEKYYQWKAFLGDDFLTFLELSPEYDELAEIQPDRLLRFEVFKPNLKEEFLRIAKEDDLNDALELFESSFPPSESLLQLEMPAVVREALAKRSIKELWRFMDWYSEDASQAQSIWKAMQQGCSKEYVAKIIAEPRLFSDRFYKLNKKTPEAFFEIDFASLFERREEIDWLLEKDKEVKMFMEQNPEAVPLLRLRFDRLDEELGSSSKARREIRQWCRKMRPETEALADSRLVPPVGVEIEVLQTQNERKWIPYEEGRRENGEWVEGQWVWETKREKTPITKHQKNDFVKTAIFGVPMGADEQWEFALDPSYPGLEARFVSELIAGEWLEKEFMQEGKYSMQVSIGIPDQMKLQQEDYGKLIYGMTAAYGEEVRLRKDEYHVFWAVKDHSEHQEHAMGQTVVHGQNYHGRLEFRPFSADRKTVYELIYDTTMLTAAYIASKRSDRSNDPKMLQLARIWQEAEPKISAILAKYNIDTSKGVWRTDFYDGGESNKDRPTKESIISGILAAQDEMLPIIREATHKIRKIVY